MGQLTTHVLDTATGQPAQGMSIELYQITTQRQRLKSVITNADGRCDAPLLAGDEFQIGVYELVFQVGAYFDRQGISLPEPKFLDQVPIRFGISSDNHYHVPLLISPYGFSTYRGS